MEHITIIIYMYFSDCHPYSGSYFIILLLIIKLPPVIDNRFPHRYMFLNGKKEASKVKQTNKAKQHSTPKAVTFSRKNELPRVGLEPTTLYTLDRALIYMYIDT